MFQAALGGAVLFNPERQADPLAVAAGLAVILLPYSVVGPFAVRCWTGGTAAGSCSSRTLRGCGADRWWSPRSWFAGRRGPAALPRGAGRRRGSAGSCWPGSRSRCRTSSRGGTSWRPTSSPRRRGRGRGARRVRPRSGRARSSGRATRVPRSRPPSPPRAAPGRLLATGLPARCLGPDRGRAGPHPRRRRPRAGRRRAGHRPPRRSRHPSRARGAPAGVRRVDPAHPDAVPLHVHRHGRAARRVGRRGGGRRLAAAGLASPRSLTPWLVHRLGRPRTVRIALLVAAGTQVALAACSPCPPCSARPSCSGCRPGREAVRGRRRAERGPRRALAAGCSRCTTRCSTSATCWRWRSPRCRPADGSRPVAVAGDGGVYLLGLLAHDRVLRRARPDVANAASVHSTHRTSPSPQRAGDRLQPTPFSAAHRRSSASASS